jgi:putative endonuclease
MAEEQARQWYLYMLQLASGQLYTGITTDLDRRIHEHNHTARGAKYTRCRRPVELVASWSHDSHSEAASAEWHFKQLTRAKKLRRIDADAAAE